MASVLDIPELLSMVLEWLLPDIDYMDWSSIEFVVRLATVSRLWRKAVHSGCIAEALFLRSSKARKLEHRLSQVEMRELEDKGCAWYSAEAFESQVFNPASGFIWEWCYNRCIDLSYFTAHAEIQAPDREWTESKFTHQQLRMQLGSPPIMSLELQMNFGTRYYPPECGPCHGHYVHWDYILSKVLTMTIDTGFTVGNLIRWIEKTDKDWSSEGLEGYSICIRTPKSPLIVETSVDGEDGEDHHDDDHDTDSSNESTDNDVSDHDGVDHSDDDADNDDPHDVDFVDDGDHTDSDDSSNGDNSSGQ